LSKSAFYAQCITHTSRTKPRFFLDLDPNAKVLNKQFRLTENEIVKVAVVAGVVIKKDGKYLLVQEKQPKAYGLWNFPAGRVDVGDTIELTAVREAKEETGYDVELIRKLDIFQDTATEPSKHAFEARIIGGELKYPESEIMGARWFTFKEIQEMKDKLRSGWIIGAISILENE